MGVFCGVGYRREFPQNIKIPLDTLLFLWYTSASQSPLNGLNRPKEPNMSVKSKKSVKRVVMKSSGKKPVVLTKKPVPTKGKPVAKSAANKKPVAPMQFPKAKKPNDRGKSLNPASGTVKIMPFFRSGKDHSLRAFLTQYCPKNFPQITREGIQLFFTLRTGYYKTNKLSKMVRGKNITKKDTAFFSKTPHGILDAYAEYKKYMYEKGADHRERVRFKTGTAFGESNTGVTASKSKKFEAAIKTNKVKAGKKGV